MESKKLVFSNLPLNEVACRFSLEEPLPMGMPFLFDLVSILQSEFPEISDMQVLDSLPGSTVPFSWKSGMPIGVRLSNNEGLELIVQKDLLGVIWRSLNEHPSKESAKYPSFQTGLMPALKTLVEATSELFGLSNIIPKLAHMYYQNFIEIDQPLTGKKLLEYIVALDSPLLGDEAILHSHELSYRMPSGVDVRVTASARNPQRNDARSGYFLRTAGGLMASSASAGPGSAFDLLGVVHGELVEMFDRIVTDKAAAEWQRV